jgi:hypothetical protein
MPVTHQFVSAKSDGTDPTKVRPSNWNAPHAVSIDLGGSEVYGTLPLNLGGTGGYDQASAINNLLPYQGWYGGYFLYTDGSNVSWQYAGGGGSGINIYVNGSYQGNYSEIYFTDWTYNSSGNNLYGADGGGGYIYPGGSYGDLQFNYYGSFYGESYLNYDFNNRTLNLNSDYGYGYYPRQINRAFYYQYADMEQWQDVYGNVMSAISRNGGFKPAQMYDYDADNNSIFFNNNTGKLAFKDPSGSVYDLY